MSKYIPGPETFFFVPKKRRVAQSMRVMSDGQEVANQVIESHDYPQAMVLFWCEHSDSTIVKSYPVKIFNSPGVNVDFRDIEPYYHFVSDSDFIQANADVIRDCEKQINLFYAHKRPDLMSLELLVVPEHSMEFLANILKPKNE